MLDCPDPHQAFVPPVSPSSRPGSVRGFAGALHTTARLDGVVPHEYHGPTPGASDRALGPPMIESVNRVHLEGVEVDPAPGQAILSDVCPEAKFDPGIRVCENPCPQSHPGQVEGPGAGSEKSGPRHDPLAGIGGGLCPLHEVIENGRELGTGLKHCDCVAWSGPVIQLEILSIFRRRLGAIGFEKFWLMSRERFRTA